MTEPRMVDVYRPDGTVARGRVISVWGPVGVDGETFVLEAANGSNQSFPPALLVEGHAAGPPLMFDRKGWELRRWEEPVPRLQARYLFAATKQSPSASVPQDGSDAAHPVDQPLPVHVPRAEFEAEREAVASHAAEFGRLTEILAEWRSATGCESPAAAAETRKELARMHHLAALGAKLWAALDPDERFCRRGLVDSATGQFTDAGRALIDTPTDAKGWRPLGAEELPEGSHGVRGWVITEGGRETTLLAFEPGGVLGEEAHECREMGVVLRGEADLRGGSMLALNFMEPRMTFTIPACNRHAMTAGPKGALVAVWPSEVVNGWEVVNG